MWAAIWIAWTTVFAIAEAIALANKKDEDTLSENVRRLFRTRTSKAGRAVFAAAWFGFSGWFALHILTETM
jgi:cytosine/uracil/thiamine/allantoin permease